jgi:hypothetical protein
MAKIDLAELRLMLKRLHPDSGMGSDAEERAGFLAFMRPCLGAMEDWLAGHGRELLMLARTWDDPEDRLGVVEELGHKVATDLIGLCVLNVALKALYRRERALQVEEEGDGGEEQQIA